MLLNLRWDSRSLTHVFSPANIYIYIYIYLIYIHYIYIKYNKKMIFMRQFVKDVFEQKVFCEFLKITMKGFVFNKVPGF